MAIQLARSIGMQGGIPQSKLPEIVERGLGGIADTIEKTQEKKEKKSAQEQAMKDAIFSKINISPPEGLPQQKAEYEAFVNKNLPSLIYDRVSGKISSQEFDKRVSDFQYQLDRRKIKYKKDYKDFEDASAAQVDYDTTDFDNFLTGTPDKDVEETSPVDPSEIRIKRIDIERRRKADLEGVENEDAISDVNAQYDAELASLETEKPVKKTIKGQQGYFNLPFEEQEKYDLRSKLDETKVPRSVGTLKAMQSLSPNFKAESLIGIHKDEKGVVTAYKDEDAIKRSKAEYIISMVSPENHGKEHAIERKAIMNTVMKKMEDDKVPNEERSGRMPEYIAVVAGKSFDKLVENTYEFESRKTNEARLLKEGSGSGEKESKTKVVKIEGAVPPAVEGYRNKVISGFDQQIDDLKAKKEKYSRALNYAKEQNDEAAVKRNKMLAETADENISKIEESKEKVKNQKFSTSDSYEFSSSKFRNDPNLALTDGSGSTTMNVSPTSIFKWGGKTYIGAVVTKGDETRDEYFPYNNTNKAKLSVNNTELVEEFDKKGFKTTEELDAEKQKKGSAKPATKQNRQAISDQELEGF